MTERPILFSAPMVRAILDGRKTQTRRVVKPQPNDWLHPMPCCSVTSEGWQGPFDHSLWAHEGDRDDGEARRCPYGKHGDRLWVREAWAKTTVLGQDMIVYYAEDNRTDYGGPWKPSIHMPRAASRITLEITAVRVERLCGITISNAIREGYDGSLDDHIDPSIKWFSALWESINGPGSWAQNLWVWVIEFKRVA